MAVDERAKMEKKLQHSGKFSGELTAICDFLEKMPIFMINDLVDVFHVSYNIASNRVDMLVKMNIKERKGAAEKSNFYI